MKKTKIIATVGPSSDSERIIWDMADAGMDAVRLNLSHGTHAGHSEKIALIKKVREKKKIPLPILLDTKGPEFRIKTFSNGKIFLKKGDIFSFTSENVEGDKNRVSVTLDGICRLFEAGDKILVNNGLMAFEVIKTAPPCLVCRALTDGELSNGKSMFFPDKKLRPPHYLSEQDKSDIEFAAKQGADFIALSFVSCAQDVNDARNFLKECKAPDGIELIAKIENREGVENAEEIADAADGVLIARGDLGTEIPFEQLPKIQKMITGMCLRKGKMCAVATEMLESMISRPRPTRAEISDVANAVYDGATVLTLTGETAEGAYPAEAVAAMAKIAREAELSEEYAAHFDRYENKTADTREALARAACTLAGSEGAKAVIIFTRTGAEVKAAAGFRPDADIIGVTGDTGVYRKLALCRGVLPVICGADDRLKCAVEAAKNAKIIQKGDKLVFTDGDTDTLSVFTAE